MYSIGEKVVLYPGFSVHVVSDIHETAGSTFLKLDDKERWYNTKNIERIGNTLRELKERVKLLEEHLTPPDPLSHAKIVLTAEMHRMEDKKARPTGGDNLIGFLNKRINSLKLALEKLNAP